MQSLAIPRGLRNPRGHSAEQVLAALQGQGTYIIFDQLGEETGMPIVIVNQGEQILLGLQMSINYTLRLYAADVDAGLTQVQKDALTESAFTEASFSGYTATTLTGGAWTITGSAPASAAYAPQLFLSDSTQPPQTLYGYYVTRAADNHLVWYERFASPVTISGADQFVTVTPTFTLKDTGD